MSTGGKSDRIDEPSGMDSLVQHLRGIEGGQEISWRKEKEHHDPPDFWMTVAGSEYAVEVTIIVVEGDLGYDARCEYLCDSINTEADAVEDINGEYVLTVSERPEIPKSGKHLKELVSIALTKMRVMSNYPCGAKVYLLKDENGSLEIEKLQNCGKTVSLGGPMRWQSIGESQEELSRLFKGAIDKKWRKVQKKGVLDTCPNVILVFFDAYGFGTIEGAKQALMKVQGYEWLHSIFWAASFTGRPNTLYPGKPGRGGVFLYSKKEEWLQKTYKTEAEVVRPPTKGEETEEREFALAESSPQEVIVKAWIEVEKALLEAAARNGIATNLARQHIARILAETRKVDYEVVSIVDNLRMLKDVALYTSAPISVSQAKELQHLASRAARKLREL